MLEMSMHADGPVLMAEELPQRFFDLRMGFAGELFQKLVSYRIRSVLVLPDQTNHTSPSCAAPGARHGVAKDSLNAKVNFG